MANLRRLDELLGALVCARAGGIPATWPGKSEAGSRQSSRRGGLPRRLATSAGKVKTGSTRMRPQDAARSSPGSGLLVELQQLGRRPGPNVISSKQPVSVTVRLGPRVSGTAHAIAHTRTDAVDQA